MPNCNHTYRSHSSGWGNRRSATAMLDSIPRHDNGRDTDAREAQFFLACTAFIACGEGVRTEADMYELRHQHSDAGAE